MARRGLFGVEIANYDELPPITPQSNRNSLERRVAHKARMEGKAYDRARNAGKVTHFRDFGGSRSALKRLVGFGSIARGNRHTGKPHEHAQEIMRNTMTPLERRDFSAKVAAQLGLAA